MDIELLNKVVDGTWLVNSDGEIDVDGSVNLDNMNLNEIPFNFGKVTGWFDCRFNSLISLKGSPKWIGLNFTCFGNNLTSLDHSPKYVGGWFDCRGNKLLSLESGIEYIGSNFYYNFNSSIEDLKGEEYIKKYVLPKRRNDKLNSLGI